MEEDLGNPVWRHWSAFALEHQFFKRFGSIVVVEHSVEVDLQRPYVGQIANHNSADSRWERSRNPLGNALDSKAQYLPRTSTFRM